MTEIILVNCSTSDCKPFYDAMTGIISFDYSYHIFHSIGLAYEYIKADRNFIVVIIPEDFDEELQPFSEFCKSRNIPYIYRISDEYITKYNLGENHLYVNYPTHDDDIIAATAQATRAILCCIELNEKKDRLWEWIAVIFLQLP